MRLEAAHATPTIDREDDRIVTPTSAGERIRAAVSGWGGNSLGSLPVIIGLAIIWVIFQVLNPFFLSSANLTNLAIECAAVGTVAIGVVLVLLIAQIDLSIGSIGGVASVTVAKLFVDGGWPLAAAVALGVLVGAVIGLVYGLIYIKFGVPTFVITLAGLMTFLGLQLWIMGPVGAVNIPFDSWIVRFTQQMFLPKPASYGLVVIGTILYGVFACLRSRKRSKANLSAASLTGIVVRALICLAALCVGVWYLNRARGLSVMFVVFVLFVIAVDYALRRTRWGRSVYSIGGNAEAARRAGIHVDRVIVSVLVLGGVFAAIGGIFDAARLASAGVTSGGGDTNLIAIAAAVIGGTSLFGGRGSAWSALLGVAVIQSISSGLTLLSLDTSVRYMVTGIVLVVAVIVDSVSRKSRIRHGQA